MIKTQVIAITNEEIPVDGADSGDFLVVYWTKSTLVHRWQSKPSMCSPPR
jgi:hypothetical protein